MARFHYSMQSILDIKQKLETQAKQDFSTSKARLDREEEQLQCLQDKKEEYEERTRQLLEGKLDVREIEACKYGVIHMQDLILEQQNLVEQAKEQMEQDREKLILLMTERKTHETLREKAFEQFLEEEKRNESKEVDQLTSYTYGQKALEKEG